jgi:rhomboid protease GluP
MNLRNAPFTIALLAINILVFFADQVSPFDPDSGLHHLMLLGAIIPAAIEHGQYYRIVTAGFLQFNLAHIGFNMYALALGGMVTESLYGSAKFLVIYMLALISGGIAAYVTTIGTDAVTAGASGAIMGLFGALTALGLKTPQLRQTLVRWALFPIILTLLVGITQPSGISNYGHVGGLVAGAILGLWIPARRVREDAM